MEHQNQDILKEKMDTLAHLVYRVTRTFPHYELYGITSQLRRAALSIILNYLEGYARIKGKVFLNFLEISYGSLKETKYLLHFSFVENFLSKGEYEECLKLSEEIGAMLWTTMERIRQRN